MHMAACQSRTGAYSPEDTLTHAHSHAQSHRRTLTQTCKHRLSHLVCTLSLNMPHQSVSLCLRHILHCQRDEYFIVFFFMFAQKQTSQVAGRTLYTFIRRDTMINKHKTKHGCGTCCFTVTLHSPLNNRVLSLGVN